MREPRRRGRTALVSDRPEPLSAAPGGPARPVPPEGGKALARLRGFIEERGLLPAEPEPLAAAAVGAPMAAARHGGTPLEALNAGSKTPDGSYLEAVLERERMDHLAPAVAVPVGWRPLGPFAIPHGQTYGSGPGSRPAVAGRISSVAVDPSDSDHILVGAGGGGVWETKDGGATWDPITDAQPALAIGAITFAPTDANTIYIGTGEGDFYAALGVGLLRSTDGGATWALVAGGTFTDQGFYEIAVNPRNEDRLLAGTTNGLFQSTNGGTAWTQRRAQRTWAISFDPSPGGNQNTIEVLAACFDGVFRSTDSGQTWTQVTLPGAPAAWQRIEVRHAPSDPDVAYVWAASDTATFLWRRNTAGGAFVAITPPAAVGPGQAWYDWFAGVAPDDANVIYVAGVDAVRGQFAGGAWTWAAVTAKTGGDSIHPDQHAITFDPASPDVVFIGNDGGVFRSPDRGVTWRSLNKGLCITEMEFLADHPTRDAYLIAGTQDNGTLRYEGEEVWYHVQDGDGGDCGVNQATPATCFHSFYGLGLERSTTGGGWGSWTWLGMPLLATDQSLFYPPMEVRGATVVQAGSRAFLSRDSGTTWAAVSLPNTDTASTLDAPTTDRVYVGSLIGHVYRIDFTGGAWGAAATLTRPRAGWCSDIESDPTNANRLWATYSTITGGHVYRSDDGGTTWTNVSAGLPVIPANSIAVDPANPDTVWVAMDVGVFRSTNAGGTWTGFNNGLPNALVKDLVFHAGTRLLRAGLQSRGVWEIAVDAATMPDVQIYVRDSRVDTGRQVPSPSGVVDPFDPPGITHWWQSTDIKIDSTPFQVAAAAVDFERFEDDHGVFAAGLTDEGGAVPRNRPARVYVQVHDRGTNAATSVAVRVFFADASLGLPPLPSGFWTGFPNNTLPATSPWQAIAPAVVLPSVTTPRPAIAAFDWTVPASAAGHSCLLAIATAANDAITGGQLDIGTLVTGDPHAALKNLAVINPPAAEPLRVVPLWLWPLPEQEFSSIGVDRPFRSGLAGVLLSPALAELARASKGWRALDLTADWKRELARLIELDERRFGVLEPVRFVPPTGRRWLDRIRLEGKRPETLVLLMNPKQRAGRTSLIQYDAKRRIAGGFTFEWV